MKFFTKLLLGIGILTLILYSLNRVEPFTVITPPPPPPPPGFSPGSPPPTTGFSQETLNRLLREFRELTPAQKEAIRERVLEQRRQLGLADSSSGFGASVQPPSTGLPPSNSAPDVLGENNPSASNNQSANSAQQAAFQSALLQELGIQAFQRPTITPAALQSMIQDVVRKELDARGLTSRIPTSQSVNLEEQGALAATPGQCGRRQQSKQTGPSIQELRKAAIERAMKQRANHKANGMRYEACSKHGADEECSCEKQQQPVSCPAPDPKIWIKRSEIPCWGCKI